jgi:hypothetical protein
MKLTTTILIAAMTTGAAWAQNPDVIENTKNTVNAVAQKAEMDRNAAYKASSQSQPAAQPATATTAKPVTASKPAAPASAKKAAKKPAQSKPAPTKLTVAPVTPQPKQGAQKVSGQHAAKKSVAKQADPMTPPAKDAVKATETASAASDDNSGESPKAKKTITAEGRRDPFVSPVVSRATGPNCSTGKRCLAIDQIMVRGVVRSDNGMIAVVVNSLNKAYFLKENDPVYNGYVLRITGDSVVFKETFQDRLGKESTREVVKKLTTPAV